MLLKTGKLPTIMPL
jgi:hypothetical protein